MHLEARDNTHTNLIAYESRLTLGVVVSLRGALRRDWAVEVIGYSALVLPQLRQR
jgi:hypothetical protein